MSSLLTTSKTLIASVSLLAGAGLALGACSHDKKYVDQTGPTTGEIEVDEDETEVDVEKEVAKSETKPAVEKEIEGKNYEYEVERRDGKVVVEGETEYPDGENPAYTGEGGTEKAEIELGERDSEEEPTKIYSITTVYTTPVDYVGAAIEGKAEVTEVTSDRGFWLERNGRKVFAVVREDVPKREMIDINEGQKLQLQGFLLEGDEWSNLTGDLEKRTRKILEKQDYFIAVYHDDVTILDTSGESRASME